MNRYAHESPDALYARFVGQRPAREFLGGQTIEVERDLPAFIERYVAECSACEDLDDQERETVRRALLLFVQEQLAAQPRVSGARAPG